MDSNTQKIGDSWTLLNKQQKSLNCLKWRELLTKHFLPHPPRHVLQKMSAHVDGGAEGLVYEDPAVNNYPSRSCCGVLKFCMGSKILGFH